MRKIVRKYPIFFSPGHGQHSTLTLRKGAVILDCILEQDQFNNRTIYLFALEDDDEILETRNFRCYALGTIIGDFNGSNRYWNLGVVKENYNSQNINGHTIYWTIWEIK